MSHFPGQLGFGILFNGCLASAARQAEGKPRGEVGKSRTPEGPSTGSPCGRVTCPLRTHLERKFRLAALFEATDDGGAGLQAARKARSKSWTLNCLV